VIGLATDARAVGRMLRHPAAFACVDNRCRRYRPPRLFPEQNPSNRKKSAPNTGSSRTSLRCGFCETTSIVPIVFPPENTSRILDARP